MFRWMTLGMGVGALVPSIGALAAEPVTSVLVSRYSEMISSVAILGLFAGVALIAVALPHVVAGDRA